LQPRASLCQDVIHMDDFDKNDFRRNIERLQQESLKVLRAAEKLRMLAEEHERRDYSDVLLDALRNEINRLKWGRP